MSFKEYLDESSTFGRRPDYSVGQRGRRNFKYREQGFEYEEEERIRREKEEEFRLKNPPKKLMDLDPHYIAINGKVWMKDGNPVKFNNRKHAENVAKSLHKKDKTLKFHILHHSFVNADGSTKNVRMTGI